MDDDHSYVMVPVPEELVNDVMRLVVELTAASSIVPWDHPSLLAVLADLDEVTRSVLSVAARASATGTHATVEAVSQSVQLTGREVLAEVRALRSRSEQEHRPPLLKVATVSLARASGREVQQRVLSVEPDVAELVGAIDQAERNALTDLTPGLRP